MQEENKKKIFLLLQALKPKRVEIFKIHKLAEKKYRVLNKNMIEFKQVSDNAMRKFLEELLELKINAVICEI